MKTKEIQVQTFGCKLNHYDSLLIKKQLESLPSSPEKKIFVLNSCAVTSQAGKEIRKKAGKIKTSHPDSLVVLTGCGAQVETSLYEKTKAVDLVIGPSERGQLKQIIENHCSQKKPLQEKSKVFKSNIFKTQSIYSDFVFPDANRTRAFLKIQDGCDSFCSFCIIPFARGKSKSLPADFLAQSIHKLEAKDVQEVVLTGVHIGDYKNGDKGLDDLLVYLLEKTNIPRIRLTSLEPVEITDKLLAGFTDSRVCPHFHISLQSTNSKVLKSMKRRYSQKEVETAFQKIEKTVPKAFVGMDMVVGFPTESHKDFEESCHLLKHHYWTNIHVFPYSPREGTYSAFKYKALPQKEVNERAGQLRQLSRDRFSRELKKQIGTYKKTLLFKKDNRRGLSRDYWKIKMPPSFSNGEHDVFIQKVDETQTGLVGVYA